MAQKSSGRPTNRPGTKPGTKPAAKAAPRKAGAATAAKQLPRQPAGQPPKKRKANKSIVNQKQTPWGLIITAIIIVLFAGGIVGAVVATRGNGGSSDTAVSTGGQTVNASDPYRQPELAAAKKIRGLTYRVEAQHTHVEGNIRYDSTPPIGGDHSQYWADCTGTVYTQPIANENAVHMLEHGAVWVTYNAKDLNQAQVNKLASYVQGTDRMAMSPYPNLKTPISLQAWGYQLFLNNVNDPRIQQFITTLRYNPKITPEPGATCSQPTFKEHPSTFGHPLWVPASGNVPGAVMSATPTGSA